MNASAVAVAVAVVLSVIIRSTTYRRQHQKHRFHGHLRRHWKIIRSPISDRLSSRTLELYLRTITVISITIFLNPEHASILNRHWATDGE